MIKVEDREIRIKGKATTLFSEYVQVVIGMRDILLKETELDFVTVTRIIAVLTADGMTESARSGISEMAMEKLVDILEAYYEEGDKSEWTSKLS